MTYLGHKPTTIITMGRTSLLFHFFQMSCRDSSLWKKLNASYVMSATDFPPRCKYKKNLANDVHCELYFLQKYTIFFTKSQFIPTFLPLPFVLFHFTLHVRGKRITGSNDHFLSINFGSLRTC